MKQFITLLLLALTTLTASAQGTLSITSTSVEHITANAVTRTFYDLDDVYFAYKSGKVTMYDVTTSNQLFYGDTSEVTVTSATIWYAKATKLQRWYQSCTHTNGYRYFMPRRDVAYLYRTSTSMMRFLNNENKRTLLETHVDSVTVSGVSGASAKLTWLRNQAFLESQRQSNGLPEGLTVTAGAAAGSSPTIAIAGTAKDFTVTLTTGSSTTSTGVLFTVTLPNTYLSAVIPTVTAGDADAGGHIARVFATSTPSTVVLNATGTALTAGGTEYVFHVHVAGY